MSEFITERFMLTSDLAASLYENYAKALPIVDYHSHIDPHGLADNNPLTDIGALWVAADPYKHRAMRIHGLPESYITGNASTHDKFMAWAETCPYTLGNPLFHWSAMELKRGFGIDELLSADNGEAVWNECNRQLAERSVTPISLLKFWNVETACTSDDLLSDVSLHHKASLKSGIEVRPSLRGDSILAFRKDWMAQLQFDDLLSYLAAVEQRIDDFHSVNCRITDHALDAGYRYELPEPSLASGIFDRLLKDQQVTETELMQLRSYVLHKLLQMYAKRHWVVQLHIGAQRYTSSRLRTLTGAAGGYATIGSPCDIGSIVQLLDDAEKAGTLPKIILYSLNPSDYAALATLTGSFAEDGVSGKIQLGPAWWWNDHLLGITSQLRTLASYGLLSHFVGMTTDSRSLLSYSRHDYFRRILCSFVTEKMQSGIFPCDEKWIGHLIKAICYDNPKQWCFER